MSNASLACAGCAGAEGEGRAKLDHGSTALAVSCAPLCLLWQEPGLCCARELLAAAHSARDGPSCGQPTTQHQRHTQQHTAHGGATHGARNEAVLDVHPISRWEPQQSPPRDGSGVGPGLRRNILLRADNHAGSAIALSRKPLQTRAYWRRRIAAGYGMTECFGVRWSPPPLLAQVTG
jgi:hypothetical protein